MKDTYTMHYRCSNCGTTFMVALPRGERATERVCPRCGCATAWPDRMIYPVPGRDWPPRSDRSPQWMRWHPSPPTSPVVPSRWC
jgi:DNA-directed RNA polymerase subunit RPC12/RpoP